jgi:hypothetical protein
VSAALPAAVDLSAPRLEIADGWIVEVGDTHTCGTGPDGHYGAHEPGCGITPLIELGELDRRMRALGRVSFAVRVDDQGGGHRVVRVYAGPPGGTRAWLGNLTALPEEAQALVDLFGEVES